MVTTVGVVIMTTYWLPPIYQALPWSLTNIITSGPHCTLQDSFSGEWRKKGGGHTFQTDVSHGVG